LNSENEFVLFIITLLDQWEQQNKDSAQPANRAINQQGAVRFLDGQSGFFSSF
jgi:hypothetical protein